MLPTTAIEELDKPAGKDYRWVRPHPYALHYWIVAAVFTSLLFYGYQIEAVANWRGSTDLHTGMEAVAATLAAMIGVMALIRYYSRKDGVFLYIGIGFLGTAVFDAFHALVTSAYFEMQILSEQSDLAPWSWMASRIYLAIFMLFSWFGWHRIDDDGSPAKIPETLIYFGSGIFILFCFWVFIYVPLPDAYYSDNYFRRPQELIPAALFLFALVAYLYRGNWKLYYFEHWLVLSLIIAFISHALFMTHSSELFDYSFDVSHLLKKISYLCVYAGLVASMYMTFRIESETNLATLRQANDKLQTELSMRKKTELQLKSREQELLRSNGELEQFAYIASHDLQEPLRKIQSFGDRLIQKHANDLDERAQDYLQRMQRAANRMSGLINDLLEFSRIHTKAKVFDEVDLFEIFTDVQDDLEVPIRETNCRIDCTGLPVLEADSIQMRRLFQNLLSNAIKFRDKQRLPCIRVDCNLPRLADGKEDYCEITISDNGIGFEQEHADRVFEVFARLHPRSEYEGTGIGLAVVRRIAERHGGEAKATSIPGEGTTFTVKLKMKHSSSKSMSND